MVTRSLARAAILAVSLGGITIGSLPVLAQDGPPPGPPAGMEAGKDGHGKWGRDRPLPSADIEARLAYMKAKLKITEAQAPQWDAFAEVLRTGAKKMDARVIAMRDRKDEQQTAIERLEDRQKMMTEAAAGMGDLLAAAKPLYAVLDADQKKIADEMSRHGGMGRGHHGHGAPF